jgi:hypothetical protein
MKAACPLQNAENDLLDYMKLQPRRLIFVVTAMRISNVASIETSLPADF